MLCCLFLRVAARVSTFQEKIQVNICPPQSGQRRPHRCTVSAFFAANFIIFLQNRWIFFAFLKVEYLGNFLLFDLAKICRWTWHLPPVSSGSFLRHAQFYFAVTKVNFPKISEIVGEYSQKWGEIPNLGFLGFVIFGRSQKFGKNGNLT